MNIVVYLIGARCTKKRRNVDLSDLAPPQGLNVQYLCPYFLQTSLSSLHIVLWRLWGARNFEVYCFMFLIWKKKTKKTLMCAIHEQTMKYVFVYNAIHIVYLKATLITLRYSIGSNNHT